MKTKWKIVILLFTVLAYFLLGVTSTDEGSKNVTVYDAARSYYRQQYGVTGGDVVFGKMVQEEPEHWCPNK